VGDKKTTGHFAWDIAEINHKSFQRELLGMASSMFIAHVLTLLPKLPAHAKCLEIGCGEGKTSALIGLAGVSPVLFDSSQPALNEAEKAFQSIGLSAETIVGDALNLPSDIKEHFNLSVSLGLNEHFSGELRQNIFEAHADVLKENGWTVIGVPCRYCLSYRVAMFVWKLTGRWPKGLYEYGFNQSELMCRMEKAGFENIKILSGTMPANDFKRFILGNLRAAVCKFTGLFPVDKLQDHKSVTVLEIKSELSNVLKPREFLSHQSYMLVAIGQKRGSTF